MLAANAILTGSLALRVWRQSQVPGRRAFAGTMMALAIWAGGYAFETLAPSVEAKTAWLRVENLGIVTLVPLFFLFALRYTGGSVAASRWALGFVSVAAAVLLLGIAAPWAANVYYLAGMVWPGLASPVDFTPLAFGVLGLVYGVGVFRLRLFDIVPLARDAVLEGLPDVVLVLDSDDRVADLNKAAAGLLGASRASLVGRRAEEALGCLPALADCVAETHDGQRTVEMPGTPPRWIEVAVSPLHDRLGGRTGRVVVARDVSGRHQAGEQIRLLSAAIGSAASAVSISDPKGVCLWVNPAFTRITGYAPEEIVGQPLSRLKSGAHDEAFYASLWATILAGEAWHGEIVNRHRDGHLYTEEQTISPVRDEAGVITHFVAVKQDVSERRGMEEGLRTANETLKAQLAEIEALQAKLRDQALRDPLTGVFNRRFLAETLARETARARRDSRAYAVVILDLDHFKRVNDTHGHEAGDRVLVAAAELLRSHTREGDLVCRYGGEEFVVLMPGSSAVSAARRAELWRAALEMQRFRFKGGDVTVTLSAGAACFPDDGVDGEAILRAADEALYRAKADGRNRVMTYSR